MIQLGERARLVAREPRVERDPIHHVSLREERDRLGLRALLRVVLEVFEYRVAVAAGPFGDQENGKQAVSLGAVDEHLAAQTAWGNFAFGPFEYAWPGIYYTVDGNGGQETGAWVVAVPEPGSAVLLLAFAGAGLVMDIVLGIVGAVVGGFISKQLGYGDINGFTLYSIVIAVLGAVIVLLVYRAVAART